eukprot:30443-Eustigmatos_ZCMA.PRE.1
MPCTRLIRKGRESVRSSELESQHGAFRAWYGAYTSIQSSRTLRCFTSRTQNYSRRVVLQFSGGFSEA